MKLPEAIQRQVEEAEALERQLYQQPEGNVEEQPSPVEPEAQAEPVVEATEHVEPEAHEAVVAQPEIKAKPGREEDPEYWRSRAQTLYGMNQQQASELHTLKAQVQELITKLSERDSRTQEQAANAANDKDAETFGEDLVATMDRRAEQKAAKLVAEQMAQMQKYVQQLEAKLGVVDQQVADTAQDRFYNRLSAVVPDYEAVNNDQGFLSWLGEIDPVYGVPRQAALDSAANTLDADRVSAIFNAYKSLTHKQVQSAGKQQVRQELERQTAPTTVRGAAQPSAAGKVYTLAEYEAALDPRNIQKMGRDAAEALASDAEAAYYEGRVRF